LTQKVLLFLNGTTLEYEETLMRQGFVFQIPRGAQLRLRQLFHGQ